jgi:hypothetical protein
VVITLLVILATLMAAGIVLMVVGKDDEPTEAQRNRPVRYYIPGRFSSIPLLPRTPVRIVPRSWRWQLGFALILYPWIGKCILAVVWLVKELP